MGKQILKVRFVIQSLQVRRSIRPQGKHPVFSDNESVLRVFPGVNQVTGIIGISRMGVYPRMTVTANTDKVRVTISGLLISCPAHAFQFTMVNVRCIVPAADTASVITVQDQFSDSHPSRVG